MPGSSSTTRALQRLPGASTLDTPYKIHPVSVGVNPDQIDAVVLLHRRDRLPPAQRLKTDQFRFVASYELRDCIPFLTRFQRHSPRTVACGWVLPRFARELSRLNRVLQALPPWLSGFELQLMQQPTKQFASHEALRVTRYALRGARSQPACSRNA